jgi:hypothetical protein
MTALSQPRRSTLALTILGLLLVATGAVTAVTGRPHSTTHAGPPPAPSAAASRASASPQTLPADLTWIQVDGVSLPVSTQDGPHDTSQGRARGFAHTPGGALLAAVHLLVRVSPQVGPDVFDPTIAQQVTGPDAATMRAHVLAQYKALVALDQVVYGQPVGRLYATLHGYLVDQYTPTTAALRILTQTTADDGTPVYACAPVRMQWTGTDWSLVAPAGGTWQQTITVIDPVQAATFTPFPEGG